MKKSIIYYLTLILTIAIMSCSGGGSGDSGDNKYKRISKIDLTNAVGAIVSTNAGSPELVAGAVATEPLESTLFKITADGFVMEVTYYDEDGNVVNKKKVFPLKVHKVKSGWAIVTFRMLDYLPYLVGDLIVTDAYLVRLSDGAAFHMMSSIDPINHYGFAPHPCYQVGCWANDKTVKEDGYGNIYMGLTTLNNGGLDWLLKIVKLDISDLNNLSYTYVTPNNPDHMVTNFDVDSRSNIMFHGTNSPPDNVPHTYWRKMITEDGALHEGYDPDKTAYWVGFDDNYYSVEDPLPGQTGSQIKKYVIDAANNITISDYGSTDAYLIWHQPDVFKLEFPLHEKILLVASRNSNQVSEVNNSTETPFSVDFPNIDSIVYVVNSDDYYYINYKTAGSNSIIIRVDVTDHSYVTIVPAGDYDIFKMVVDENDKLTFNARDLNTGKYVIGEVDFAGNITITDDTSDIRANVFEWLR